MGSGASKKPPPPDLDAEAKEFEAKMEALSEEEKKAAQKQRNSELRKRFVANLERGTLARDAARATMVAAGLDDKSIAKVLKRAESMPADYVDPVQAKIDERAKARLENQAASVPASVLVSQSEQRMAALEGTLQAKLSIDTVHKRFNQYND